MSGSPTFDTEKKKKKENRKTERGEFITPPRPTGRRSKYAKLLYIISKPTFIILRLLIVPRVRLVNYGERSFSYAAPKLWNEIQEYIRKSETLSIFKTKLKTYLFRQYYD